MAAFSEMTLKGKTVPAPSMAMPVEGAANRYDLCQVVRGPDRIALVPFASKLLFAVADEKDELPQKTSMALVTVFEHSSPRVLPLSGAREAMVEGDDPRSRSYTFELLVKAPSEYSRTIVVARRFGAVDLDQLTETISDLYNHTGADRIDALSNLLQTRYPGYVEFGYRSTEADVECNRHP